MKKVLAIAIIGPPLGCALNILMVATVCLALFYSCTNSLAQLFTNPGRAITSVATAAVDLASHLTGKFLNDYNAADPVMSPVIKYWEQSCGSGNGTLCDGARSGNLQCVEFVTGAFSLAHISLPYHHDAHYFWADYKNLPDWREIPMGQGLPEPGDIVVWRSTDIDPTTHQKVEGAGHVAIVVAVIPPIGKQAGRMYIAQANATSNMTLGQALTHELLGSFVSILGKGIVNTRLTEMPIYPDDTIDSSPDFQPFGYIRYLKSLSSTPVNQDMQSVMAKMPNIVERQWVPVAWNDALKYGIPPNYFIKQIYLESNFDPNAVSHDPKTGKPIAYGIAQFIPATASGMGINPLDPTQALDASARLMRQYYCTYIGGSGDCATVLMQSTPQARSTAYGKALAAYNGGPGVVAGAVANCGEANWFNCLGSDVQNYLLIVAS